MTAFSRVFPRNCHFKGFCGTLAICASIFIFSAASLHAGPSFSFRTLGNTVYNQETDNAWVNGLEKDRDPNLMTHVLYPYPEFSVKLDPGKVGAPTPDQAHQEYPDDERIPIILIHGIQNKGGFNDPALCTDPAELVKDENSAEVYWDKFVNGYLHLNDNERSGEAFKKKYRVFLYHYPTYKHITYNARVLKDMINGTDCLKGKKVVIVAHSMGGLLARSLIEEHDFRNVLALFTLATPHHGSPGAMYNWITEGNLGRLVGYNLDTPGSNDLFWDNYDGVMEWANSISNMQQRGDGRISAWGEQNSGELHFDQVYTDSLRGLIGDVAVQTYEKADHAPIHRFPNPWLAWLNEKFRKNSNATTPYFLYGGYNETDTESGDSKTRNNYLKDDGGYKLTTPPIYRANLPDGRGYVNDGVVPVTSAFLDWTKHDNFRSKGDPNPNLFTDFDPDTVEAKSALYYDDFIQPAEKVIHMGYAFNSETRVPPRIRFFKDYDHTRMKEDVNLLSDDLRDYANGSWLLEKYADTCPMSKQFWDLYWMSSNEIVAFTRRQSTTPINPLFDTLQYDLLNIITPPISTSPYSPVGSAPVNPVGVAFSWGATTCTVCSGATSYRLIVQEGDDTVFDSAVNSEVCAASQTTCTLQEPLKYGTDYTWAVIAKSEYGAWNIDVAWRSFTTSPDTNPPGSVGNLVVSPYSHSAYLSWTNPTDGDFAGVLVVRSRVPIAWSPENGKAHSGNISSDLVVVHDSSVTAFMDTGLSSNVLYYYAAFAHDNTLNYAPGVTVTASTLPGATVPPAPSEPTDTSVGELTGSAGSDTAGLSWSHALNSDFRNYLIVRGAWSPAANTEYNTDGTSIICKGSGTVCFDSSLSMDTDYTYTVYAFHVYPPLCDEFGKCTPQVSYGSGVEMSLRTKLGGVATQGMNLTKARGPYTVLSTLTIPEGTTLRLEPGTVVKFAAMTGTDGNSDQTGIVVQGTLIAEGTQTQPIIFTSINDHSIGGATGSGIPSPGDWDAIRFESTSTGSRLSRVVVKYGGYTGYFHWRWSRDSDPGAIQILSSSVTIANSEISENSGGIYISGASPTITASNILKNALWGINCTNGSTPTITNNVFDSNENEAILMDPSSSGAALDGNTFNNAKPLDVISTGSLTANTTWHSNGTYVISGTLTIPEGTTLRLEPGTVVKFAAMNGTDGNSDQTGIVVQGTLIAEGTQTQPIVFTSINDHSIGGATGSGTPSPGDWDAIRFESTSTGSRLSRVVVKYGGYTGLFHWRWYQDTDPGAIQIFNSSVTIANSEISENKGGVYISSASSTITASNFLKNALWGIYLDHSNASITQNIFKQNTSEGIRCANGSTPTIISNLFDGNENEAIWMDPSSSGTLLDGNTFNNAKPIDVISGGSLTTNTTWHSNGTYVISGTLTIPEGTTLRLEPGTVVKFAAMNGTDGNSDQTGIVVQGTLIAEGTQTQPIVFTSINDHSIGGATGSGTPSPGDWDAIRFESTSTGSRLSRVVVKYGGYTGLFHWRWYQDTDPGAIQIFNSSVTIANSEISENKGGVYISSASSTITASNFLKNALWGIYLDHSNASITQNIFKQNTSEGIRCANGSTPTIISNLFDGNENEAIWMDPSSSGTLLDGNTFNNAKPIDVISGGSLTTNTTWHSNGTYVISGTLTIPEGTTLRLEPGTVVKFAAMTGTDGNSDQTGIVVQGTLIAEGTQTQPIIFTSINDHSIGGATGSGIPSPGDWDAIRFESTSTGSRLSRVVVKYGGYTGYFHWRWSRDSDPGAIQILSSSVTIANSEISENSGGIYISGASPAITASNILKNALWGINCTNGSTPTITNNVFDSNENEAILMDPSSSGAALDGNTFNNAKPLDVISTGSLTANTTWHSNGTYVISGTLTIPEGTTLRLEPGTVVKFAAMNGTDGNSDQTGIVVQGTLIAEGTQTQPIVFTSINDHSIGGATGSGTPSPGDWDAIRFESTSTGSRLSRVVVKYGGYTGLFHWRWYQDTDPGAIQIFNSSVTIANSEISENKGGVYIYGVSPTITASNILKNALWGINCTNGSTPTITNNVFDSNENEAILMDPSSSGAALDGNTFNNAKPLDVISTGSLTTNTKWHNNGTYVISGALTVPEGITLTIESGAVIKFIAATYGVSTPGAILVRGTLDAQGTQTQPIVFTSINDHSVGGATGSGTPSPGEWDAIRFASTGTGTMSRVVVKYGGYTGRGWYGVDEDTTMGAIQIFSSSVTIANSEISENNGGIYISGASPTITTSSILKNTGWGIYLDHSNVSLTQNIFRENTSEGIRSVNGSQPTLTLNSFTANGTYGVYNADPSVVINAVNNDWGNPTGPLDDSDDRATGGLYNPTGLGDRVSDKVNYATWVVPSLTVTATVTGGHGSASPSSVGVNYGTTTALTLTPDPGYAVSTVTGCGGSLSGFTYTTGSVTAACAVTATFTLAQYTVTGSVSGSNGTISCTSPVSHGAGSTCTITPVTGYFLSSLTDNGTDVFARVTGNTYVVSNVTANHTVTGAFSLKQYTVTASSGGHGSISPSSVTVNHGTTTAFTLTPETGYKISSVTGCGGTLSGNTYTTGSIASACAVSAAFTPTQFAITASSGGNGTVTPLTQSVNYGSTASITITPTAGYHIVSITDNGVSKPVASPYAIANVTAAHTVAVTFSSLYVLGTAKYGTGSGTVTSNPAGIACGSACATNFTQSSVITLTATPDASSTFTGWSGGGCSGTGLCTVTLDNATRVTATFDLKRFEVTASSGGGGTALPSTQTINYSGTATITITPTTGYHVATITDNGVSKPITNPYVITNVTAPHAVAVTFSSLYVLSTVKSDTGSGTVTSTPAGITCGSTCSANFTQGSLVTLTATPDVSSTFAGWSGGGCSGTSTCTVIMNSAVSVTAAFALKQFTVTASSGGNGTVAPLAQNITYSSTAIITVTPSAGYHIAGITDNGASKPVANPYTISNVTGPHAVAVTFSSLYILGAVKSGTGTGTVTSTPAGINCGIACATNFTQGSVITLTATPDVSSTFTGWSGGGCSGTGVCKVTMNSLTRVTATFTLKQFAVTASSGGNGTVTPLSQNINYCSTATITITPTTGYHIATITDNGVSKPITNPYVITNVTVPHAVAVTFSSVYILGAVKSGTGTGTVTSTPAGINCGIACATNFTQGSVITLTATPDVSSTFTGWSGGGCSGTGICKVTLNSLTRVTATFTLKQFAVTASVSGGKGAVTPLTQNINYGSTASITVTPTAGYHIASITDNGVSKSVTSPYAIPNVTAPHAVAVAFSSVYILGAVKSGTGSGTVTSIPAGINCGAACATNFTQGSVITLTATPDVSSTFTGWSGGGCSGTGVCKVTLNSLTRVTAAFTLKQFAVTASSGGNGTVTPLSQNVGYGNTAAITVTPNAGYQIRSVAGCGGTLSGLRYTTGRVSAPCAVTASFVLKSGAASLPSSRNFGNVAVGGSRYDTFSIHNEDDSSLTVQSLAVEGDAGFVVKEDGCSGKTLSPGYFCSFTLSFAPSVHGVHSAEVLVHTDRSPMVVPLVGTGIADAPYSMEREEAGHDNGHCLSAMSPDGTVKWSRCLGNEGYPSTPALGPDGTVYAANGYSLFAFNPDGTLKWQTYTKHPMGEGSPLVHNGTVIAGADRGVYAFDQGSLKWQYPTDADFSCSTPVLGPDGTVYIGAKGAAPGLYAIREGKLQWHFPSLPACTAPAVQGDTVYFGTFNPKGVAFLHAVSRGAEKWKQPAAHWFASPAVGPDGTVYAGTGGGSLSAFTPRGALLWTREVGCSVNTAPVIGHDGAISLGTFMGLQIFAPDGTPGPDIILGPADHETPAAGKDGTLYLYGDYTVHEVSR